MRHWKSRILAIALAITMLAAVTPAMAAEDLLVSPAPSTIAVQLDGENLTFTDAAPEVVSQRTFLPLRAVFEAMGATVSYEGNVITAVRGDKTLTMTVGSAEAAVTEGGVTTPIAMDVAPYTRVVDQVTGGARTYVPVRFAAQAFGCAVGWDQDDLTVIIVDTEELMDSLQSKYQFTYLNKYLEYSQKFNTGKWAMKADFTGDMSMMGMGPIALSGALDGLVADATKGEMTMNMKLDMLTFLEAMAKEDPSFQITAEDKAMLEALKKTGIDMEMRMDMDAGMVYMTMDGAETLGLPSDVWYSMDLGAMFGDMGMDYTALMALSKELGLSQMMVLALQSTTLDDKDTAYATVSGVLDQVAKLLADSSFVKKGSDYTTTFSYQQGGDQVSISLALTMSNDKVVGYAMDMKVASTTTDAEGNQITMAMSAQAAMDAENHMTANVTMEMDALMSMELTMSGDYATTTKVPQVTPPQGATVIPFDQMAEETPAA
jgi:hypothetical protein